MLRQEGKFIFGTVTSYYEESKAEGRRAQNILAETSIQEQVEATLTQLKLPYSIFDGAGSSNKVQSRVLGSGGGLEELFQSIWQSEHLAKHLRACKSSLIDDGMLDLVLSFAKKALEAQIWGDHKMVNRKK